MLMKRTDQLRSYSTIPHLEIENLGPSSDYATRSVRQSRAADANAQPMIRVGLWLYSETLAFESRTCDALRV
jgi:hypothetical protein